MYITYLTRSSSPRIITTPRPPSRLTLPSDHPQPEGRNEGSVNINENRDPSNTTRFGWTFVSFYPRRIYLVNVFIISVNSLINHHRLLHDLLHRNGNSFISGLKDRPYQVSTLTLITRNMNHDNDNSNNVQCLHPHLLYNDSRHFRWKILPGRRGDNFVLLPLQYYIVSWYQFWTATILQLIDQVRMSILTAVTRMLNCLPTSHLLKRCQLHLQPIAFLPQRLKRPI